MKKLLLSCFMALGIGASAQYNVVENFDGAQPFGGLINFGAGMGTSNTVFCSGTTSLTQAYSTAITAGGPAIDFSSLETPQTSNGQKIAVSINYRKTASIAGTLYLTLNVYDPVGNIWNLSVLTSKTLAAAAVTTCTPLTATIGVGTVDESTLPAGAKYSIGAYFQRSAGTGSLYYDDLSIVQEVVTVAPSCVAFTSPTEGAILNYGQVNFTWPAATGASAYKLTVGTTAGGSDVLNETVSAANLSKYVGLNANTNYFAKIVPMNNVGNATGCTEVAFSTNGNLNYCGPISYTGTEPITNVKFAGIDNTTSAATAGAPSHEFFLSTKGEVEQGKSYDITLNGNTDGNYTSYYVVFIDWNNNGILNEAGEVYFANGSAKQTNATGTGAAITITNGIVVPAGATLGDVRMRVKKEYSAAVPTATGNFPNPCMNGGAYGQAEDYTITVKEATMATSAATKSTTSVYPNPFQDVLKISDVKGVKSISVSDVSGRQVKNMKPATELNLSDLKTGMYIVTLNMEDGTVKSFKTIKK